MDLANFDPSVLSVGWKLVRRPRQDEDGTVRHGIAALWKERANGGVISDPARMDRERLG